LYRVLVEVVFVAQKWFVDLENTLSD
jgi:hypothetical protein